MTTFAIAVLLGVALLVGIAWWRQERIAYQPPAPPHPEPGEIPVLRYAAADGQPLLALLVGGERPTAPLLLAFHGNADLSVWQIDWAREVHARTGWRVMLAEYRGYGGLGGQPTYTGLRADARAAWRQATEVLGATPERAAFYGHSLGTAVAVELAAELPAPPAALVLLSPLSSARDMARIIVARPAAMFYRWISRIHYDTEAAVRALDVPVHVAHGTRDFIMPSRMGRAVHAAAKRPGALLLVEGAGHNDVADVAGERYWAWITDALRGAVPAAPPPPPPLPD